MNNKEVLKQIYRKLGANADYNLTGDLLLRRGLGPYETLTEGSGPRYLLLPKTQANLKSPIRFSNMSWPNNKMKQEHLNGHNWQARSYIKDMRRVTTECLSGGQYCCEDGLRKVEPYFDCLSNYVSADKYPGSNITLADYFTIRFPAYTRTFFEILIEQRQLVVNCEPVDPDYVIKDDDVISHLFHRHENDVLDLKVDIVFENDDFLVVDKPSSWPVYPIGNYRFNSLQYILLREYGYKDLRTVHRIDAPTSGLTILAKKPGVTGKIQKYFRARATQKQYLTLVDGCFPEEEIICETSLIHFKISPVKFIKESTPKEAKTIFRRVSYDAESDTSIVECTPVTGRTHQIRLHLQHLGFFIVNDGLYNPRDYEPERTEVSPDLLVKVYDKMRNPDSVRPVLDHSSVYKHQYCPKCLDPSIFPNPAPSVMCLHSYKYSLGDDFTFQSNLPAWATNPDSVLQSRILMMS